MDKNQVKNASAKAGDSKIVEQGARVGHAANGLLHLVIGWLMLQLAFGGGSSENADQTGALKTLAESPIGLVLMWAMIIGLVLLAIWQITEAIADSETKDRVKAAAKAVLYLAIAGTAFSVLRGAAGSGDQSTQQTTGSLLDMPFGQVLVGLVGLVILGVGGYHIYSGVTQKFTKHLAEHPPHAVLVAGRIGYVGKGIALLAMGALFGLAAVTRDPEQAGGTGAAVDAIRSLPLGLVLLVLVAIGFVAYGVFSFGRAKYGRV